MWISVLWHSRFHCPGIVLLGTQKYDIEAYTGTILNFFPDFIFIFVSDQRKENFDKVTPATQLFGMSDILSCKIVSV